MLTALGRILDRERGYPPVSSMHVCPPIPHMTSIPTLQPVPAVNRLLAGLPRKDRHHLLANCDMVDLIPADLLYRPGERMRHVYFPVSSFISLVAPIDGHAGLEVGLVRNEGMLRIPLMLGVNVSSLNVLVQRARPALRMTTALFRPELRHTI